MASDTSAKLAVLIDADNASPAAIEGLLAEVAKYGTAHVRRAYGDWTGTSLQVVYQRRRSWPPSLLRLPEFRLMRVPVQEGSL